jgi:hypothetical protein
MPNVQTVKTPNPYSGTYIICLKDDPSQVIERREITSQIEFQAILDEVIKYNDEVIKYNDTFGDENNAFGNEGPQLRKLIKAEN